MKRVSVPELLDSGKFPQEEVERSLRDIRGINHKFGGVSTTKALIEKVAARIGKKKLSVLDVATGNGELPLFIAKALQFKGFELEVTLLDHAPAPLVGRARALAGDALSLPFRDNAFDLITCNLFAHHLEPPELSRFGAEAWRVCRHAVLINDLVRHPLHLALVYAARPLLKSPISRFDGVASVRRAYVPQEIGTLLSTHFPAHSQPRIEISRHFLYRMGVIVWKDEIGRMK